MQLTSPNFGDGQAIPADYTCQGLNQAPDLIIDDVPEGTLSLALLVTDPDSANGNFVHWLMWNIPPTTTSLYSNQWPNEAKQGYNDFGLPGYGGPCPAEGLHHYHFRLVALDILLDLSEGSYLADLESVMYNHILTECELVGLYQKT
jgi:Raf kinase inhibitor-like YbhB/YbcL family protein